MRVFHSILLVLVGCQAPSVPDYRSVDTLRPIVALADPVYAGATLGAASLDGFAIVANVDGALSMLDPLQVTPHTLRAVGPAVLGATSLADGTTLIAADSGLWIFDSYLRASPVQDAVGSTVLQVAREGGAVWLRTAEGLHRWSGGSLSRLDWDGAPLTVPFALGGKESGIDVVWSANARGLVALGDTTDGWLPVVSLEGVKTSSLAVDRDGVLVAATDEGVIVRQGGEWSAWSLPNQAATVLASRSSAGVWLVGSDAVVWTDGTTFESLTDLPADVTLPQGAQSVDDAGRLLLAGEGALYRVAHAPTVAVVGLRNLAAIDGETTVAVQATPAAGVSGVDMVVDDAPLAVDAGSAVLDPFAYLDDATHHLQATVTWDDGREAAGGLDFTVRSVGAATWTDNVEPLFQARCAKCHAGSTQTRLDSRDAWESKVDTILDDVTQRRMPLGGPPLSGAEISIIRAWQDGGFL